MSSKIRWAAAAALAAGLVLAGGTSAFAGTPSPSPSQQTVTPDHHVKVKPALWQFDFTGANIDGLQLNDVRGVGPIPMARWQETDLNPFTSRFSNGPNSVTLRHNRLPLPSINLNTCTATFDQLGNFRIVAGTGTGAGFLVVPGTDEYLLRGTVSVDFIQKRGHHVRHNLNTVCPLQFVNPWQIRAALESNSPIAGQIPTLTDFDVQGNAQLVRVRPVVIPTPTPTGPGHFFAPSVNPNPDQSVAA
jgi:hypothetical protein